nr:peptidylprolyl isomerase [Sphingomonas sp. 37zxx]
MALVGVVATPTSAREPARVRVRLETSAGPILIAVDTKRAPATAKNFLAYVDDGRFNGVTFYRAARSKRTPGTGFVQGGIRTDARRILPPFPLEPTSKTGIRHLDATISMARGATPEAAGGNFFITIGPAPSMDARPDYPGYAAFGRVIGGMDSVKRILAVKTGGGFDAFRGQMILKPIRITRAVRLDGTAKPTKLPRMWLTGPKRAP